MSYSDLADLIEAADRAEARGDLDTAARLTREALSVLDALEVEGVDHLTAEE